MYCPACKTGRLGMALYAPYGFTQVHELTLGGPGRTWEEYKAMKLAVRFEPPPEDGSEPDGMFTDHVFKVREAPREGAGMSLEILTVPGVVSRKPKTWEEYAAFDRWEREEFYTFYNGVQAECFFPDTWKVRPEIHHSYETEIMNVREAYLRCGSCGAVFDFMKRRPRRTKRKDARYLTERIPFGKKMKK